MMKNENYGRKGPSAQLVWCGALACLAFTGCGEDRYRKSIQGDDGFRASIGPAGAKSGSTGNDIMFGPNGAMPHGDSIAAAVSPDAPDWQRLGATYTDGIKNPDSDYIAKADIYWKLNFLKKSLELGIVPPDMERALDEIKIATGKSDSDEKKRNIEEILTLLEEGLEAHAADRRMRSGGQELSTLPWGSGRSAFEQHFKSSTVTNLSAPKSNSELSDVENEIVAWEEDHHKSPKSVSQASFRDATVRIHRLGNSLGLLGRPENSGPGSVEAPVTDQIPIKDPGFSIKIPVYRSESPAPY